MLEDKDFELLENDTPVNAEVNNDPEITDDDFTLTKVDESIHEQKIQTKPTTFLKDSLRRFRKNKSSVVAAYILGALLLMSFLIPIIDPGNTSETRDDEAFLAPKLFEAGTGFWDGTIKYSDIAVDISAKPDASTPEEMQEYWWPGGEKFKYHTAISKKKFTDLKYINDISDSTTGSYAKEGYVQFGYLDSRKEGTAYDFTTKTLPSLVLNNDLYLTMFDTYDMDKVNLKEGKEGKEAFDDPENYHLGECAFYFKYTEKNEEDIDVDKEVKLVDYALVHNIGSAVGTADPSINIAEIIQNETGKTQFDNACFAVRMVADGKGHNTCCLIGGIGFDYATTDTSEAMQKIKDNFALMSFTDATRCISQKLDDGYSYWSSTDVRRIFLSKAHFCSFVFDTYEAVFGKREEDIQLSKLMEYQDKGWISFKTDEGEPTLFDTGDPRVGYCLDTFNYTCKILDAENCPLVKPIELSDFVYDEPDEYDEGLTFGFFPVKATFWQYKRMGRGYKKIPKYLMGTDKNGRDMLKYTFEGLRTSLLLGFLTFIVCFLFGLLWGSICGYFGGTVDLLMERFTDILAGVPWIVVMTLIIIHMGSNFWTFALALCMTGWIGTAARTRTQFYRFRGREYVLASRTLGASDARLIAKHILPNALGTIITGAVLMIPSVIFSEATISYLGLGLKNLASLGVILSANQVYLKTEPYLLIFPAIIISLIMISFNLFGNGLRDAINPSLKGED